MTTDVTLTSYILNPWTGDHHGGGTDLIALSYADLDYIPSANDPYKSTSGDVFKVYVNGIRIYRTDDQNYAGGNGFLEDTDSSGIELNNRPAVWTDTSNAVWTIDTATQKILLSKSAIAATALYGSSGLAIDFTISTNPPAPIIELRRAVQDLKTPAVDFSNASILTEQDLDNSAKNVFHVAQQAVISTENAMLYDSGSDTYKATQPGTPTPKRISSVATPTGDNDAANKTYVDGSSSTVTVANNIANVNTVAGISSNVTTVAGISADVTAVANDATDIGTVAGQATEIGRLGTADAVADMAILGTADVVNDMNILATTDVVNDMNVLGTADVVNDMNVLGTTDNVTNMQTLADRYDGTTDQTTGTNLNIANINTVATNIATISAKVSKSGDTMTGALTLSGAPTADNHASTKAYTDSQATALALALG
jgi:hypothetical protein